MLHLAFDRNSHYVSSNRKLVIAHFICQSLHAQVRTKETSEGKALLRVRVSVVVGFVGLTNGILYP